MKVLFLDYHLRTIYLEDLHITGNINLGITTLITKQDICRKIGIQEKLKYRHLKYFTPALSLLLKAYDFDKIILDAGDNLALDFLDYIPTNKWGKVIVCCNKMNQQNRKRYIDGLGLKLCERAKLCRFIYTLDNF